MYPGVSSLQKRPSSPPCNSFAICSAPLRPCLRLRWLRTIRALDQLAMLADSPLPGVLGSWVRLDIESVRVGAGGRLSHNAVMPWDSLCVIRHNPQDGSGQPKASTGGAPCLTTQAAAGIIKPHTKAAGSLLQTSGRTACVPATSRQWPSGARI
jgi:hypothetical protein